MVWSRPDPGAGEPGGIRYEGRVRRVQAEELRAGSVAGLRQAVGVAQSSQWQGKAATAFADAAQSLIPEVLVIAAGLENDAAALDRYAGQVEHIKADAQALRAREASLWRDVRRWRGQVAGLPDDFLSLVEPASAVFQLRARLEHRIEAAEASLRHVEAGWDDLTLRRRMADAVCVAALTSVASRGNLAAVTAGTVGGLTALQLLERFGSLSAIELAIVVRQNPGSAEVFWTDPPDPGAVRVWWAGLDPSVQSLLVAGIPLVIGNLDGVTYASRVLANKLNLTTGISVLQGRVRELIALGQGGDFTAKLGIPELEAQIAYYTELRDGTVSFYDPSVGEMVTVEGHNILVFDHEHDAIAEYSGLLDPVTGNIPDFVQNLGVYVPGTNSTLANFDFEVRKSEWFVNHAYLRGSVGMITWKGGAFPHNLEAVSGGMADALGQRLAHFGLGLEGTHQATVTGIGYSFGGSTLGSAEHAGLSLDRSLQVSSAGMGHGVWSVEDYPNTAEVPHYSMMAPDDYIVGVSQGFEGGDWGHGASTLSAEGFTRLETGYMVAGDPSSGQIEGHLDVWTPGGTAMDQMLNVLTGGRVELYARPEVIYVDPSTGLTAHTNPVMDDGYTPQMVDVAGGER